MDYDNLDMGVVNLARAIRQKESSGGKNQVSKLSREEGSFGGMQYTVPTFQTQAKLLGGKDLNGNPLDINNNDHQNLVFYTWAKKLKDEGYGVDQIAAAHNAGEGKITSFQNNKGTNKFGNKFDTPAYVNEVLKYYNTLKGVTVPQKTKEGYDVPPAVLTQQERQNNLLNAQKQAEELALKAKDSKSIFKKPTNLNAGDIVNPIGLVRKTLGGATKNFLQGVGETVASSQIGLGKSIGGALSSKQLQSYNKNIEDLAQSNIQTAQKIKELETQGKNADSLKRAYNTNLDLIKQNQQAIGQYQESLPSNQKVLGQIGGTALDVLTAGQGSKGLQTGKLAMNTGSTLSKVGASTGLPEITKLAKETSGIFTKKGASNVLKGTGIGYASDVTQGLQGMRGEDREGAKALIPGLGTAIGSGIPAISETAQSFKNIKNPSVETIDNKIKSLYQNVTTDVGKINDSAFKAKKGLDLLQKEQQNIKIPSIDAPLGKQEFKTFDLNKAKPNEFLSATLELDKIIANKAKQAANIATDSGVKIDTSNAMKIIEDEFKNKNINRSTFEKFKAQIEGINNKPINAHDWVESVNKKYKKKYERNTIDDTEIGRVADDVAESLRKELDTVIDRKGYSEAYSNNQEVKRLIIAAAKKANKKVNFGNIYTEAGLDSAIATLTGNPLYLGRTLGSGILKGGINKLIGNKPIKTIKQTANLLQKKGTGARLPSSEIKSYKSIPSSESKAKIDGISIDNKIIKNNGIPKSYPKSATKSIPQEQFLINEAKKYKSADEFVKAQEDKLYIHGTQKKIEGKLELKSKAGGVQTSEKDAVDVLYVTPNTETGKMHSRMYTKQNGVIYAIKLKPEAKIFDYTNPSHRKMIEKTMTESQKRLVNDNLVDGQLSWMATPPVKNVKKLGFDGMKQIERKAGEDAYSATFGDAKYSENAESLMLFNKNVFEQVDTVQTKSQLTDIWKEANKKTNKQALPKTKNKLIRKNGRVEFNGMSISLDQLKGLTDKEIMQMLDVPF